MAAEPFYSSLQIRPYEYGGGWRAQLRYKDGDKWRQKTKTLKAKGKRAAQREAEAWRAEMEAKAAYGRGATERPKTVMDFLTAYVDTLDATQAVERSTLGAYRDALRRTENTLAAKDKPFDELDALDVQAWVVAMKDRHGYSPATIRKALRIMKTAYKKAVDGNLLAYNPAASIAAPAESRAEPNALSAQNCGRLLRYLEAQPADPRTIAIVIAVYTGMRQGEICALRWRDVDTEGGELHVRQSIGHEGGKEYIKTPKTSGSRRDVPMAPSVAALLMRRRAEMAAECMAAGVAFSPDLYALGDVEGHYLHPQEVYKSFRRISRGLELTGTQGKPVTFRDLRHTFATVGVASGADVKSVSSSMGHSNTAMTLNVYATADPAAKRAAVASVARVLDSARDSMGLIEFRPRDAAGADSPELRPTGTEG